MTAPDRVSSSPSSRIETPSSWTFGQKGLYLIVPTDQQALLSTFDFLSWSAVSKCVDQLLKGLREEFRVFVTEGWFVAKISLQSPLDVAGASARVMAALVTLRRTSWLQNSGITLDVQQDIEDLPFDIQT